ncbi:hypothetical protein CEXT_411701 [Caerostris extrusa]|uniref:Uncharacterized protein n=1 Tax=Caerostris extrusa TaxID=172846 RepID=A0AAV4S092_CAEEX|nr:hypothetical protein CEXT_411701 [Caerostris extrusa]
MNLIYFEQFCEISRALSKHANWGFNCGDIRVSKKLGQFRNLLCEVHEPAFILKVKSTRLTKLRRIFYWEIKFMADTSLDSFNETTMQFNRKVSLFDFSLKLGMLYHECSKINSLYNMVRVGYNPYIIRIDYNPFVLTKNVSSAMKSCIYMKTLNSSKLTLRTLN